MPFANDLMGRGVAGGNIFNCLVQRPPIFTKELRDCSNIQYLCLYWISWIDSMRYFPMEYWGIQVCIAFVHWVLTSRRRWLAMFLEIGWAATQWCREISCKMIKYKCYRCVNKIKAIILEADNNKMFLGFYLQSLNMNLWYKLVLLRLTRLLASILDVYILY